MIEPCDPYLEAFAKAADVQLRSTRRPTRISTARCRRSARWARRREVAINPATPPERDRICARPARPHAGDDRQSRLWRPGFIPATLDKVARVKRMIGIRIYSHRSRRRGRRRVGSLGASPARTCLVVGSASVRGRIDDLCRQHQGDPRRSLSPPACASAPGRLTEAARLSRRSPRKSDMLQTLLAEGRPLLADGATGARISSPWA